MEKNINMYNVEELCTKYVLNELDPSEVLLVEKAMRDDENILIEIESMRATLRKLDKLPEKTPPAEIREKILNMAAASAQVRKSRISSLTIKPVYFTIAAVLLVGVSLGLFSMTQSDQAVTLQPDAPALSSSVSGTIPASAPAVNALPANSERETNLEPWVDRQNVLHINISSGANGMTVLPHENSRTVPSQLKPVNPDERINSQGPQLRNIQLTRNQQ